MERACPGRIRRGLPEAGAPHAHAGGKVR